MPVPVKERADTARMIKQDIARILPRDGGIDAAQISVNSVPESQAAVLCLPLKRARNVPAARRRSQVDGVRTAQTSFEAMKKSVSMPWV